MTEERTRQLEILVAGLKADLAGHIILCDGRWRVIWKLAAALSGLVALAVSLAVTMLRS